jgi:hypothetical protein
MTYEQLVESRRSAKYLERGFITGWLACYRCDGQPTRTYTNKAGNKVVVYFYWLNRNEPVSCDRTGCSGGYSQCEMAEEQFEFVNDVISNAKYIHAWGYEMPLYSNGCEGYGPSLGRDN